MGGGGGLISTREWRGRGVGSQQGRERGGGEGGGWGLHDLNMGGGKGMEGEGGFQQGRDRGDVEGGGVGVDLNKGVERTGGGV